MLKEAFGRALRLWGDDRGAVNTVELIGYSVIIAGAAALVGYGFTAASRGKTGAMTNTIHATKAMSTPAGESANYTYNGTSHTDTGVVTGATGN